MTLRARAEKAAAVESSRAMTFLLGCVRVCVDVWSFGWVDVEQIGWGFEQVRMRQ